MWYMIVEVDQPESVDLSEFRGRVSYLAGFRLLPRAYPVPLWTGVSSTVSILAIL